MRVRIFAAGAAQVDARIAAQAELRRVQRGVLTGQDQLRDNASNGECVGYGLELDGFGPGANDQPYIGKTQSSP